ncbi:MAG: amidohydrolase family protein, partial [Trebonia sp.]
MGKISNGILFTGGSVFDGTGFLEQGTHVLVRDGKISAVGTDVEPGTADIVDLDGGTLLPGFIDAHAHPVSGGLQLLGCDLEKGSDSAAYLDIVARYAAANPGLEWVIGGG